MSDPLSDQVPPSIGRRRLLRSAGAGVAACAMAPFGAFAATPGPVLARPIPRTGEHLPVIGLGTAIVFDIAGDAEKRAERRQVLRTLIDGGGRLVDTAPSYGTAESVLGDLVADLGARRNLFIATKVRVASREASLAEMARSLERLRMPQVDLIQLHNVTDAGQSLALLREWRDRGHARMVGLTHFRADAYDELAAVIRREKPEFVQINYSLAERGAEAELLPVAADTGTAVLVNLPFGRGSLFRAVRGKPLPEWAQEFDARSWAQLFLKFIVAHPAVTCVIPGTDKPEYMIDNLDAGRGRLPDAAMRKRILDLWSTLA